jgi:hypothetical protein
MVRGVPDPAMCPDAFSDVENPSIAFTRKFSLKPFRVDPASLHLALKSLEDKDFPMGTIHQPV